MSNSDILIVTITYNPPIDILNRLNIDGYKSLVIDNSDTQMPWLLEFCQKHAIEYITNLGNLGIAKALNLGCEYAIKHGYTWAVTMDQDSQISEDILFKIQDFINNYPKITEIAIVSPRHVINKDYSVLTDEMLKAKYINSILTMTSGNFVNLDVWQKLDGFNNELFIDMVDVEYYCKALLDNYKVLTIVDVVMEHGLGVNFRRKVIFGKIFDILNHNAIRKYYQVRNSLFVYFKYKDLLPDTIPLYKFVIKQFIVTILYENNKLKKLKYMLLGCLDYKRQKFGKLVVK